MHREPIAIINAVVTGIQTLIPIVVAFGISEITKEQSAAIISGVAAWGGLLGTFIGRNLVTPVTDPRDSDGKSLKYQG
jgi:hypothetical protein